MVNILILNFYKLVIWLKSNYFGESTKPLCPLCLWQYFIELDSFEQFVHSIFPRCCCLFGCPPTSTSPPMSTKPCFLQPYIFLQTYHHGNLSSSPHPHMMFIHREYIFLLHFSSLPQTQGCISCGILVSGIRAREVSSEHMENMELFSCSQRTYSDIHCMFV